jgi:hypothetical protein
MHWEQLDLPFDNREEVQGKQTFFFFLCLPLENSAKFFQTILNTKINVSVCVTSNHKEVVIMDDKMIEDRPKLSKRRSMHVT